MSGLVALRNNVLNLLKTGHFQIVETTNPNDDLSFDLLARFNDGSNQYPLMLIKILQNIDNIRQYYINELKLISHLISAIPLFIAVENRHSELKTDSIYIRDDIFVVNLSTFEKIVKNPHTAICLSYAKRGGFFHDVDGKKLSELREKQGYSRKILAEKMDVSSKSISHYEKKEMRASIENAKLFHKILGDSVIKPVQFFQVLKNSVEEFKLNEKLQLRMSSTRREFMQSINEIIERTEYNCFWPKISPFDLFIYRKNDETDEITEFTLVGGTECDDFSSHSSKEDQNQFLKTVSHDSAIIYDEDSFDQRKAIKNDLPYIKPKELEKLENPKEFKKMIIKRRDHSK